MLAPLRAVPGAVMDLVGEVALRDLATIADEPTEPMPGLEFSTLLDRLDDETIDALVDVVGAGSGSPHPIFQIRHLGGAFRDVVADQSSAGTVPEEYSLFALGVPAAPGMEVDIAASFRRIDEAVAACSSGRALLAFLGEKSTDCWWSDETRVRLMAAKSTIDPLGVIRSNRPVGR